MKEEFEFRTTEFMTKEDKQKTHKDFARFFDVLKDGRIEKPSRVFTKRIHKYLYLHGGFIANYDKETFYNRYFEVALIPDNLQKFISEFESHEPHPDYADVDCAIKSELKKHRDELLTLAKTESKNNAMFEIAQLIKKHSIQKQELFGVTMAG